MKIVENPFSPGAGAPPPELVGREDVIEQADILFSRVKRRRSEKSMLLTGLRGVGKTVLLNHMQKRAQTQDYCCFSMEAPEYGALVPELIPSLRKLISDMSAMDSKSRRALAVLKGFAAAVNVKKVSVGGVAVEFDLDIDAEYGTADSGHLENDLINLFIVIAETAQAKEKAVAIFIDEIQCLSNREFSALIMAMHKMQQLQLPLVLVGAGLPVVLGKAGNIKSYAERLFDFPDIGRLSKKDTSAALQKPVQQAKVSFNAGALQEIFKQTDGYPYFIQTWGYQAWNQAKRSPISRQLVKNTYDDVINRLDENFFRVRYDRLTPKQKEFLRAMAEIQEETKRTSNIASILGLKNTDIGPVRDKLIKKGMAYSPAHGYIAFTVPLFDDFMRRVMPDLPAGEAH